MFERNRIDSGVQQAVSVAAEVELEGGDLMKGRFLIPAARSIGEVLNSGGQFVEFEPYGEARRFLSKSAIRAVKVISVPNAGQLDQSRREAAGFDPYLVLGVTKATPWEEVRHAYIALSKTYHPDRFGNVELPKEVADYLSAMASRVNIAYAALERAVVSEKAKVSTRVEPIYTSRPRA